MEIVGVSVGVSSIDSNKTGKVFVETLLETKRRQLILFLQMLYTFL